MSESEMENPLLRDEFRGGMHDNITEVDLFLENCSSLYNLVLDSLHDLSAKSITWQYLDEMSTALLGAGRRLAQEHPDMEGTVSLRINTISSAMEQLRLRKGTNSDTESCGSRSQASSEIRSWIHLMEKRLIENEDIARQRKTHRPAMTKLLADQQVLQLEIQTEGQALITRLYQQFRGESGSDVTSESYRRRKATIDAIRKKWHTVYLNSLSLQFSIEEILNKYQEDSESEDPDLAEPPVKRARHSSTAESDTDEDTLPFAESEYESIMDGRATVTSVSSEDSPVRSTKWDSVQQDIGYSSGENSVHEALNTIGEQTESDSLRRRLEASPAKSFYRMVLDDMSDVEIRKALDLKFDDVAAQLTDSMHVNYEQNSALVLPEYDEVMALMDEDNILPSEGMNDSFNTQWREIRGRQSVRKGRLSKEALDNAAKNSCDASSEDSSDWEPREDHNEEMMSRSFNSALTDGLCHSLKRNRGSKKGSNYLLDCSEMDASFCSTRSDMPPCMGRSLMRKKLRVRRMPRSMSDGEQLGVKSGLLTPSIRVSPPSTPLCSSTRLLRQLDSQLQEVDSDTAPEHSDAPAYEWDEYRPPEKDDSIPDGLSIHSKIAEDMLAMDEDFGAHFGQQDGSTRLVSESRAHLRVVEKCIENGDVDQRQMSNIELICRTNLRQLDTAIQMTSSNCSTELRDLRQQWSRLMHHVASPASQLLNKVGRFASSLRDLHETSSASTLNGLTEIRSKDDVRRALEAMTSIRSRLSGERDELRSLLASKLFRNELSEVSSELEGISMGYDEAVGKLDGLVMSLGKLNDDWTEWSQQQHDIRMSMSTIEEKLKATNVDQVTVLSQMELCQERMDSLETMCNYLTSSIQSIQDDGSSKTTHDFRAEIMLYANALEQLKSKFYDVTRVPSPPTPSAPLMTSTPIKRRISTKTTPTQTTAVATPSKAVPSRPSSISSRVYRAISSSWVIKMLLGLSALAALAALFWAGIFGSSFGPHMRYVNGPPPV